VLDALRHGARARWTLTGVSDRLPRVRASELEGRGWLNTGGRELSLAELRGKTARQRAEALIGIAHPDFRGELREAARRMNLA